MDAKEEILNKYGSSHYIHKMEAEKAMDEYSNKKAVEFNEWLDKNATRMTIDKLRYVYKGQNYYSLQELYSIFEDTTNGSK